MQFFLPKFNYNFSTTQTKAEAYSPFAKYINDVENKRSKLFPDRVGIPGRKFKYALSISMLIHVFMVAKLIQNKRLYGKKANQQTTL
jgi:hypothetical protein